MHRTSDATAVLVAVVAVVVCLASGAQLGHLTGSACAALTAVVLTLTSIRQPRRRLDQAAVAVTVGFAAGAAVWWPVTFALIGQGYQAPTSDQVALFGSILVGAAGAAIFVGLDAHRPAAPHPDADPRSRSSAFIPQPVPELREAAGAAGTEDADTVETDDTVLIPVAVAVDDLPTPARRGLVADLHPEDELPVLPRRAS